MQFEAVSSFDPESKQGRPVDARFDKSSPQRRPAARGFPWLTPRPTDSQNFEHIWPPCKQKGLTQQQLTDRSASMSINCRRYQAGSSPVHPLRTMMSAALETRCRCAASKAWMAEHPGQGIAFEDLPPSSASPLRRTPPQAGRRLKKIVDHSAGQDRRAPDRPRDRHAYPRRAGSLRPHRRGRHQGRKATPANSASASAITASASTRTARTVLVHSACRCELHCWTSPRRRWPGAVALVMWNMRKRHSSHS